VGNSRRARERESAQENQHADDPRANGARGPAERMRRYRRTPDVSRVLTCAVRREASAND
jgi:hypothetical protein